MQSIDDMSANSMYVLSVNGLDLLSVNVSLVMYMVYTNFLSLV